MVGDVVNHYRIVRKIGAGGMGEVYEAEDTRLNRKVAVKVLPRALAADPERRERFEREARAIAALNHPNIVTIHSVEDSPAGPILTMELIEGQSLDALIPKRGMSVPKLLDTALAMANALAAAQQRGITHRDLKPANVMVSASGQIKVLDFGLARLGDESALSTGDAATQLVTSGLTGEGRIVGTVAYMSPEQAEGRPVDSRSDIFSTGVVLHEMATGTRPFAGDTPVSIISSIVKDTPASVTDLRSDLPPELSRIIKRCLAKDPERRYQSALDLRNDLDELRAVLDRGDMTASGVTAAPARAPRRPRRALMLGGGVAFVAMAIVTVIGFRAWFAAGSGAATVSLENMRISRLTDTGRASRAALSPDGRYVVHVIGEGSLRSLWLRQTNTSSDVQIVPPADVRFDGVTVSPDSTYVYYSAYEGAQAISSLYRIPALGGSPLKILEDIDSPIAFSPDGAEFVFVRGVIDPPGSRVVIARADGSNERILASAMGSERFLLERPSWSPDGRRIAVTHTPVDSASEREIVTIDVATGEVQPLGSPYWLDATEVAWLSDGSAVLVTGTGKGATNGQIWQVDYPSGQLTRITNDLTHYEGISLSADSRALVTVQAEAASQLWVAPATDPSDTRQITSGSRRMDGLAGLAWLPDDRLVYTAGIAGNFDIWVMNQDGSDPRPLTIDEAHDAQPAICGGGRYLVFASLRSGLPQVWRASADGADPVLLSPNQPSFQPVCTPEGTDVLYTHQGQDGRFSLWRAPLDRSEPVLVGPARGPVVALSPDGQNVISGFVDAATNTQAIGVFGLGETTPSAVVPSFPRFSEFSPDGRAVTYIDVQDGVANIWRYLLPDGPATQLTAFTSGQIFAFAWSPDGSRLAIAQGTTSTDVVLFTVDR